MARVSGRDGEVYFDSQDLSGESNNFELRVEQDTHEVTAFSDSAKTFVEGDYTWTVDFAAFYSGGANTSEAKLHAALSAGTKAMTLGPEGTATVGDVFYNGDVFVSSFAIRTPVDGAITVSAQFQGSGALTRTVKV